jgi:hypothetical protein
MIEVMDPASTGGVGWVGGRLLVAFLMISSVI